MHIPAIRHTMMLSTQPFRTLKHWLLSLFTLLMLASLFSGFAQAQQGLQPIPPLTKLVVDQANILSPTEEEVLWQKLLAFEKAKGSQIAVITVPTTAPEDIFSYSQRAAETYKLGRKGVGDGVLIVVAANDRKVWIYVMRHLEGAIPDVLAKRVTNEYITPAFKQGQYAAGLEAATTQLMKLIEGEQLPAPSANAQNQYGEEVGLMDVLILIGALAIIGSGIAGATSRWLVAPPAGGVAGLIAYTMTSVLGLGLMAGIAVFIFILIFGGRSYQMATQRSSNNHRNNDIFWGGGFGGGWGGGSGGWGGGSGGGFGGGWGGSGGGGDAGGGGAGGSW